VTDTSNPPPRRAWARRLLGVIGLVLVLVIATPVWFPWLLVFVSRLNGVSIGDHKRIGISRLRLVDVNASLGSQTFQAKSLEIPQPLTWLLAVARSKSAAPSTPLWVLRDWTLRPNPETNDAPAPSTIDSVATVLDQAEGVAAQGTWLGVAGLSVLVPTVEITERGIHATVDEGDHRLRVALTLPSAGRVEARASLSPDDLVLESTATRNGADWTVAGSLHQHTNRVNFQALMRPGAWLPATATLQGDAWSLPLPKGLQGSVRIQAQADWVEGNGTFALAASGTLSLPDTDNPLPLSAEVQGRLTPQAVTITRCVGDWTFASARLQSPVRWDLQEPRNITGFAWDASLRPGAVPEWGITGTATITLRSTATELSRLGEGISFELLGTDLQAPSVGALGLSAIGEVDWPVLQLQRLEATLASGSQLAASATADLLGKQLQKGSWTFDGQIPGSPTNGGFQWPVLHASGTAAGPFTNLLQTGNVQSIAETLPSPHETVMLDAHWRIQGLTLEDLTLNATQGTVGLHLQGRASYETTPTPSLRGAWTRLDGTTAGQTNLALAQPLHFEVEFPTASNVVLRLPHAHWQGSAGELQAAAEIDWPTKGRFTTTLREFNPAFLTTGFGNLPPAATQSLVRRLTFEGSWKDGPLVGRGSLDATVPLPELGAVRVQGSVAATADGVQFEDWSLTRQEVVGPQFSGRLPVRFHPAQGLRQGWETLDGPLQGALTVGGDSWPWKWLATRTGAELTEASARIDLAGTLAEPRLQLAWNTAQVRVQIPGRKMPPLLIGSIAAKAHASSEAIVLESLTLDVEGQTLRAEATIPWQTVTNSDSASWATRWMPDLQGAEGQLDLPEASVSALAKPLEEYLQPGGTLRGHVERRDAAWHGWLELTNVTTRPIPALGILRDIDLRLVWADDKLQIARGQAFLSGQPLALSGAWTLPNHPKPEAGLRLTATNLAIVRSPELILRADLDLTLSLARTNPSAPPVVGGLVTLHDSVVTMDVRDLVAVDLERPRQRPPFFSVEQPPLSDWTLDVRVRGDRFARILSPILKASASADLNLRGTLGQPKLIGQAFVDRGRLAFPFGQLEIQQFQVVFTEADPYRPRLEGKAEGLSFGYNLGMELGGTLSEPEIGFSSTPPMTTSEVLQMLMAGSLPRNEYSYSTGGKAQNVGTYLAGDLLTQLAGDPMEEPRLTFRSAQRVSANGSLTYSVEYRLSDRWSAVAEYDRWNQLGAGVRWRVLEK
jgi:translocation and assembly module TamB